MRRRGFLHPAQVDHVVDVAQLVDIRRLDRQRQFEGRRVYHTRQAFSLTIGWPALQAKAFWNSGIFCSVPSTR